MLATLALALVLAHPSLAQTGPAAQTRLPGPFTLVKDYDGAPYNEDALRQTLSISAGAYHFFTAYTADAGTELWRTDGTPDGTLRLHDICPGHNDGVRLLEQHQLAVLNNQLLFAARNCASGTELWISDGTPPGTHMLIDLQPGAGGSGPNNMVVVGGYVFFVAYTDQQSRIWRSDGSASGTTNTGWRGVPLFAMNGALYFRETSSDCRLFKLDAVTLSSTELSSICPTQTTADRERDQIAVGSNIAIYVASTPANGSEVWRTDGTPAGTRLLSDIATGNAHADPSYLAANGANFAFAANDGIHGAELWKSDGGVNTSMVRDINVGAGSSHPSNIVYHNNVIYFTAYNSAVTELWLSNGFAPGTRVLVDTTAPDTSSSPYGLRSTADGLYFVALINEQDYALFKSDGTVGNATQLRQANIDYISAFGAGVFLAINDPTTGIEAWFSNGTPAGTVALGDLAGAETVSPAPVNLRALNGVLLHFGKRTATTAAGNVFSELYRSDGTPAGSQSLRGFAVAPSNAFDVDYAPVVWNNQLFFNALPADDNSGRELWRSGGTTAGTTQYVDLAAGQFVGSDPADLIATTNRLYFIADTPAYGPELWQTSGMPESTSLIKDIVPGTDGSEPKYLTADDSSGVYFSAYDAQGNELWRSDGTPGGTTRVRDLLPGSAHGSPAHLTWTGTRLFFTANSTINFADNGVNRELWVSDGTEAGTLVVKDITPGEDSTEFTASESDPFVVFGDRIVFAASTDTFGAELWISDGTETGTRLIKDIASNAASSNPEGIVTTADKIYFAATDATGTRTLWVSDGTSSGTLPVLSGAGAPVNPEDLTVIDGVLYFSAADAAGAHGRELWISDGTTAGTRMLQDLNPGPTNSNPTEITRAGNRLYLAAYTPGGGRELWSARLPSIVYLPLARR